MNKQQLDSKQNTLFNSISLGDPKKLSTQELEKIVFNNLKTAGEKLQNPSSPLQSLKQTQYQSSGQEQGYGNQVNNQSQISSKPQSANYSTLQTEQQQKTLPINRNTPSFSNVIINDSLFVGQENTENTMNNNHNQIQLNSFSSPQFNSPSSRFLFQNTNRGETMTKRELENSNQIPQEKKDNNTQNSLPIQSNPFQGNEQISQVQTLLSTIENPFSQNLFANQMKNQSSNSLTGQNINNNIQKVQNLPPKQLETPNRIYGMQQRQEFQRNVSEQSIINSKLLNNNSNKENTIQNNQNQYTQNTGSTQIDLLGGDFNNLFGQSNAFCNSKSTSSQKLRSVSPSLNGWSDSTSPAIAGAMKVLKDKCTKAESELKELQSICQKQQAEIKQLREHENLQKTQWEEKQKESFLKLSEQTGSVLGEITKLQTENAHVQNENAIMQKQIDVYKNQIQELTQEVLYLRKCNDIIEGEKTKHLEHNAYERDELDQKFTIMEKLRKADKQLIDKLENDIKEYQNSKYQLEDRLKKIEIENDQLKNELYDSQENLEGKYKSAESKLSLQEKELNLIKEKYEKERNFNQKRASIYAEKDQRMKQMQEENIDLRSQVKSLQSQLDYSKKTFDQNEKQKQKMEREKYSCDESYKQLKSITEEIIQLASREGNTRVKEIKRLEDGIKKTSESSSLISSSVSKSKLKNSRGPSKEKKRKDSSESRINNFSASKTKKSMTSNSANKFYKQASPRSSKNKTTVVTVVSNKKIKSNSKVSRNSSQNKVLHLEDLDQSIESRKDALAGSSSVSKLNNNKPVQKRLSRNNSLVLSQNNSLDFDSMSPHNRRKVNVGQAKRSTSRQRSVSKNSDNSASKSRSKQHIKQNTSQISQNSYVYFDDQGGNQHDEDDFNVLVVNQSQTTAKPTNTNSQNVNKYKSINQNNSGQSQSVLTEPKIQSNYVQSYHFPENFERMTEAEISNEIFKLERAVAETKREYNNLLSKSKEKNDINIEEMRNRMNELAIDMQKQSDWQFVLKKRQREIITMSFGKQSLHQNIIN